jgi:hypothetical protein
VDQTGEIGLRQEAALGKAALAMPCLLFQGQAEPTQAWRGPLRNPEMELHDKDCVVLDMEIYIWWVEGLFAAFVRDELGGADNLGAQTKAEFLVYNIELSS